LDSIVHQNHHRVSSLLSLNFNVARPVENDMIIPINRFNQYGK